MLSCLHSTEGVSWALSNIVGAGVVGRAIDWIEGWRGGRLLDEWLVDWVGRWSFGRVVGWLTGWLAG